MDSKWFGFSRRLWTAIYGLVSGVLVVLTLIDPAMADLLLMPVWAILGGFGVVVTPERQVAIRGALIGAGVLAAVGIALWRRAVEDPRTLTVLPGPVKDVLGR
jgi:hypothetical protein